MKKPQTPLTPQKHTHKPQNPQINTRKYTKKTRGETPQTNTTPQSEGT